VELLIITELGQLQLIVDGSVILITMRSMEIVHLTQGMLIVVIIIHYQRMLVGKDKVIRHGILVRVNGIVLFTVAGIVIVDGMKMPQEQPVKKIVQ
jgi:hypothetical protein